MRCLAPRDLGLPVELTERLATDPESEVRHAVAGHPNLPAHARRALLADPDESVARATAAAPTLPVAEMGSAPHPRRRLTLTVVDTYPETGSAGCRIGSLAGRLVGGGASPASSR
ncbi:hypothetical protein [Micromonospora sp. NPDC047187]|uniref:hypothetical protein n=1 Tax=Micromonospora sp. NPDC047187 TaxID=3155262 RepID=UPI0033F0A275